MATSEIAELLAAKPTTLDIRITQLSYSTLGTLHSCPRKFQLYKLQAEKAFDETDEQSVTFAYGHVVGLGIQLVFEGKPEQEVIWQMFCMWKPELFADNPKQQKSFWLAVTAVQKLIAMRKAGYLRGYELVYTTDPDTGESKPAVELGFSIYLPNGFVYRGYVDAVLRHVETGEVVVLECKTTSAANLNAAMYKNSAQGIGYSVVLDVLFPDLSSYKVIYLVYKTKEREWDQLPFDKSYLQRALWIQELLLDCEIILLYDKVGVYPMRGESCYNFFHECEYYGLCTLATQNLTHELKESDVEKIQKDRDSFAIKLTVQDLIDAQLKKGMR